MILLVLIMVLAGCGDSESGPITCAGRGDQPEAASGDEAGVTEAEAAGMSIAELLMTDPRFDEFRNLAAQTVSEGLGMSWLEAWDMQAEQMGDNRDGVTVFVPVNAAFERLDPGLASVLREGELDNELRYTLLGHHYVHRLYPSSEWESGSQRTWRGGGIVELTLDPPMWGGCPLAQTDIRVDNGYIHVLDGIVIPDEIQQAAGG
jgi:uncharacterized surface protein with fasciclin (FAS1) repeats